METRSQISSDQLELAVNSIIKTFAGMNLDPLQALLVLENTRRFIAQQHGIDVTKVNFEPIKKPKEPQEDSTNPKWN